MAETTPVTLLTGFPGAGKTTVLNQLLKTPQFDRAAVLVDEFGDVAIGHRLVRKIDNSAVPIPAGCQCCIPRSNLVQTLRSLLPRARLDQVSRVVIQTSGLADPVPTLAGLLRDPAVAAAYRLDSVIAVIDTVNGLQHLDRYDEARRQVAVADWLVLTNTDLADGAALRPRLRALNPAATVLADSQAVQVLADMLDSGGRQLRSQCWTADDSASHGSKSQAVTLTWSEPVSRQPLLATLRHVVATHGDALLRVTGQLWFTDESQLYTVQGAGHLLQNPEPLASRPTSTERLSRLIIVTDRPLRAVIEAAFSAASGAGR